MSTLAPTSQTAGGTAKRVTIGSVCKAAAAVAVVGMISVFSITLLSRAQFAPPVAIDTAPQPELRSLLCRIDRRCTAANWRLGPQAAIRPAEALIGRVNSPPCRLLENVLCLVDPSLVAGFDVQ